MKVGVILGSSRYGSFSKRIAEAIGKGMPSGTEVYLYEENMKQDFGEIDGFLYVTPEYDRWLLEGLKKGQAWRFCKNKPGMIIGISPGRRLGQQVIHCLRQYFIYKNIYSIFSSKITIRDQDLADPKYCRNILKNTSNQLFDWIGHF